MKVKRSTGIKRITILATVLLAITPVVLAVIKDGYIGDYGGFVLLGAFPVIVYKIAYWIADGFQRDKE